MVRLSSGKDSKQDYGTPQNIFEYFNRRYGFTLDAAASHENAKCKKYFTEEDNGLIQPWKGEIVWLNPPYKNVGEWVDKILLESKWCSGVLFVNNDNRTKWYRKLFEAELFKRYSMIGYAVRFEGAKHGQSVGSVGIYWGSRNIIANVFEIVDPRKDLLRPQEE